MSEKVEEGNTSVVRITPLWVLTTLLAVGAIAIGYLDRESSARIETLIAEVNNRSEEMKNQLDERTNLLEASLAAQARAITDASDNIDDNQTLTLRLIKSLHADNLEEFEEWEFLFNQARIERAEERAQKLANLNPSTPRPIDRFFDSH